MFRPAIRALDRRGCAAGAARGRRSQRGIVSPELRQLRRAEVEAIRGPVREHAQQVAIALTEIESAHELANPAYALEPVSRTFHGRDLFAPAAAHLALGVEPSELGPPLSPDALVRLDLPKPEINENQLDAHVLYEDSYGNVAIAVSRGNAARSLGLRAGERVWIDLDSL